MVSVVFRNGFNDVVLWVQRIRSFIKSSEGRGAQNLITLYTDSSIYTDVSVAYVVDSKLRLCIII